MKKYIFTVLSVLSCVSANAQQKAYICKGFNSTPIDIQAMGDLTFSEGQKHVYVGGQKYDLADVDSITFAEPIFKEVKITYDGANAKVMIPSYVKGVTASVNGANVALVSTNLADEILYTVSGQSTNGSLTINGEYKLTVALDGLTLASSSAKAPINIACGKRIGVILRDGTDNVLMDASSNTAKGAFYTDGHAEFEGGGSLSVTGKAKHAICVKEYLQLKKSTGTINILGAVSDGIHCGKGKKDDENNYFLMSGGNVTVINAGSDCIDCDDYGCAIIKGGKLMLNVSQTDGTGLKVDSCLTMTGGNIVANVMGNVSEGIRVSHTANFDGGSITETVSGNGARGIRAKKTTKTTDTVLNGGYMFFNGTDAEIVVAGKTNTADNTVCYGLKADAEFKQTAGNINITMSSTDSATKAYNFKTNTSTGGTLTVK